MFRSGDTRNEVQGVKTNVDSRLPDNEWAGEIETEEGYSKRDIGRTISRGLMQDVCPGNVRVRIERQTDLKEVEHDHSKVMKAIHGISEDQDTLGGDRRSSRRNGKSLRTGVG